MRLAGKYGPGLTIQSRMDRLDLELVNAFLPGYGIGGNATGSLDFAQPSPGAFPRAEARLSLDSFTRTTAVSVSQPVDVNFVGRLLPDGGEGSAVIRRRGSVIGRMVASLRPLGPGAGGWVERVSAAPLGGGIRYNGPADTLWSFVGNADQSLSGPIAVGADFSGRLQRPQLAGIVRGQDLTYTNQTYGTRLSADDAVGPVRRRPAADRAADRDGGFGPGFGPGLSQPRRGQRLSDGHDLRSRQRPARAQRRAVLVGHRASCG